MQKKTDKIAAKKTHKKYKTTDFYAPEHQRALRWNDPALGIRWPIRQEPLLSAQDATANLLSEAEVFD